VTSQSEKTRPRASRRPRTESEWLELKELEAREGVRRAIVALGQDAANALGKPELTREHPALSTALEHAGGVLASDSILNMIETSVAVRAMPPALRAGMLTRLVESFSRLADTKPL
jgi:hypothetical protein